MEGEAQMPPTKPSSSLVNQWASPYLQAFHYLNLEGLT